MSSIPTFKLTDLEAGKVPAVTSDNQGHAKAVCDYVQKTIKRGEGALFANIVADCKVVIAKEKRQAAYGTIKRAIAALEGFEVRSMGRKVVVANSGKTNQQKEAEAKAAAEAEAKAMSTPAKA
jgi:hypothetical protein